MSRAAIGLIVEKLPTDASLRIWFAPNGCSRSQSSPCGVSSSPATRSTSCAGRMVVCGCWSAK